MCVSLCGESSELALHGETLCKQTPKTTHGYRINIKYETAILRNRLMDFFSLSFLSLFLTILFVSVLMLGAGFLHLLPFFFALFVAISLCVLCFSLLSIRKMELFVWMVSRKRCEFLRISSTYNTIRMLLQKLTSYRQLKTDSICIKCEIVWIIFFLTSSTPSNGKNRKRHTYTHIHTHTRHYRNTECNRQKQVLERKRNREKHNYFDALPCRA